MGLGIILKKEEMILSANSGNALRVGTTTIEMDQHDGTSTWRDGLFDERVINLECIDARLYQDRDKPVLRDRQNGGDIGIGRHDYLVALFQYTYFYIRTHEERQGIKPVSHTNAILRTNITGILLFKSGRCLTTKVPARVNNTADCLMDFITMHSRDTLERKIIYHSVHSYQS